MECLPTGPFHSKIMAVAEAPGIEEAFQGKPLIGSSGREFTKCSLEAGLPREDWRLDNVFHFRPPSNKFHAEWCRSKKEVSAEYKEIRSLLVEKRPDFDWPPTYNWANVVQGKYVMPEHLIALPRLRDAIRASKPNLVVALGGTALWALCGVSGIKKMRGTIMESTLVPGLKILPTWHPSYILRAWDDRLDLVCDLMKAKGEMKFPEIVRPSRKIWINPTIEDLYYFYEKYIKNCSLLGFDTETARKQITCISFAPTKDIALVIPFVDKSKPDYNYWPTLKEEVLAWRFVKMICEGSIPKLAQNGLYDVQYLLVPYGIAVRNFEEDTMLLHHSIYIELKKDLGYLGSIYTGEPAWKLMRHRNEDFTEKKDE